MWAQIPVNFNWVENPANLKYVVLLGFGFVFFCCCSEQSKELFHNVELLSFCDRGGCCHRTSVFF